MKNYTRCPWCGRKISMGNTFKKKLKYGLAPVRQCPKCYNPLTTAISTLIYTPIFLVFLLFRAKRFYIKLIIGADILIVLACSIFICLGKIKYKKMGLDGKTITDKKKKYIATVTPDEASPTLRRGQLLITDKNFDDSEPFSVSAPIKVLKYSKSKQKLTFIFLYMNDETQKLADSGSFYVYAADDRNNKEIWHHISLDLNA